MRAVAIAADRTLAPTELEERPLHRTKLGSSRPEEFQEAVELLAAGALPADRLITGRAPLEDAQSMFERLEDPATEDIKAPLTPHLAGLGR